MARITYQFRPPIWQPPQYVNYRTGVLLAGTGLWWLLYVWLGLRLARSGIVLAEWTNASLVVICIGFGVILALGWRSVAARWLARLRRERWAALSLEQLYALAPGQFEEYVAQRIFARQGYRVRNTPDIKDGGVDIVVIDEFGRAAVVQCKRYRGTVGEATVRDLYGTMIHSDAAQAYLVTTGAISESARRFAVGKPIGLIDGKRLLELSKAEPASVFSDS
jgi:restriction system protein